MLRYLGTGIRRFGIYPMAPHERGNWEVYVLLRGRIAPVFLNETPRLRDAQKMWAFPPLNAHGWVGDGAKESSVAAFSFAYMPEQVSQALAGRDYLEADLDPAEGERIESIAVGLCRDYDHPTEYSELRFQKAMLELSLILLSHLGQEQPIPGPDRAAVTVNTATEWYARHLGESPSIATVAAAVHASASHLRRLFQQVNGKSPRDTFFELRLKQAMRLLSSTDLKLEAIASMCGFSGSTDFCRSFKSSIHMTPSEWRRALPPYDGESATRTSAEKSRLLQARRR